ncbi:MULTISPECIES: helix-hairpin-helix domain-containing protein [unclassified Streptomyces]|uniref:helix-hairpin-helix domain-containing protein n=1 Tax=unclassified Streptomyces TaxID=2593676 RepID=UPI002E2D7E9E|nr:helix-hairpin-helix domain-containing protein [Streptomyces sp. NBC_00441]
MGHRPFFRWILALGLLLITGSACAYAAAPEMPELRQLDLTVLSEKRDGACTVRWTDPYEHRTREGAYRCDPDRDPQLKAPSYDPETGHGWTSGFLVAEGPDKGELYVLGQDDDVYDERIALSDRLIMFGLPLLTVGLVGGNIRAAARLGGVRPGLVDRAWRLAGAAAAVEEDRARAVEAVRAAWAPLREERVREELGRMPVTRLRDDERRRFRTKEWEKAGVRTVRDVLDAGVWELGGLPGVGRRTAEQAVAAARRTADAVGADVVVRLSADRSDPRAAALVTALHVLVAAGPEGRDAADAAEALSVRLEPLLADAAPATGWATMLRAGPADRRRARSAVAGLRYQLAGAERDGLPARFGQTSVDLLRAPGGELDALSARTDFERRPRAYYDVLAEVTRDAGDRDPALG